MSVHEVGPNAIPAMTEVLARAFQDDPVMSWIFPKPDARAHTLRKLFPPLLRVSLMGGPAYMDADESAVATWIRPDQTPIPPLGRTLRSGLLAFALTSGLPYLRRLLIAGNDADGRYRRYMPEPCWVLEHLGVDPARQGRGLGSAVLQPILDQADETGTPCFLLTHKEANVAFYGRHGFEVVASGSIAPKDPTAPVCFAMRRYAFET